jgi:F-type H+-transporting ATPase subunit delta
MAQPRVASRYAKSLLDLAVERNELDRVALDMERIERTLLDSSDLLALLASPVVKADAKLRVLHALFAQDVSELSKGFIDILVQKGREPMLIYILKAWRELLRKKRNILSAEVRSAVPLSADSREGILSAIGRLHSGAVELKEVVDPTLIGGYVLRLEDKMMDVSIKRQLAAMRRELVEHQYEPGF